MIERRQITKKKYTDNSPELERKTNKRGGGEESLRKNITSNKN